MSKWAKLFSVLAMLAIAGRAFGLSCMELSLREKIERKDTIVYAFLTEAHISDSSPHQISGTFEAVEVIKGKVADTFVVITTLNFWSGDGVRLTVGFPYLLFFNSDTYVISSCGGTSERPTKEKVDAVKKIVRDS